jgi:hypothetical protein
VQTAQAVLTIATPVVAAAAFVLSVFNAYTNWVRGAPRFEVEAKASMIEALRVVVRNTGNYPVIVERFSLTRRAHVWGGWAPKVAFDVNEKESLPKAIPAGGSAAFSCETEKVQQAIDSGNNVVCVQTADGRMRHSRPNFSFRWARQSP